MINDNKIKKLPRKIGDCCKLKCLNTQNNYIAEFPNSIGRLNNITDLGLDWFVYLPF